TSILSILSRCGSYQICSEGRAERSERVVGILKSDDSSRAVGVADHVACGKCLEPSLNSRRRVLLRNSQQLASANGIARDGAREENRSGRPGPTLLLLPASFVGVGRRPANCHCEKCHRSWQLLALRGEVDCEHGGLAKRRAGQSPLAPGGRDVRWNDASR